MCFVLLFITEFRISVEFGKNVNYLSIIANNNIKLVFNNTAMYRHGLFSYFILRLNALWVIFLIVEVTSV